MRKHRLAECMLVDVLGMPWEEVHAEACRWEHVMSESVERRLLEMLDHPTVSPYGNPIPGLDELTPGAVSRAARRRGDGPAQRGGAPDEVRRVIVRRIAEPLQDDGEAMTTMHRIGAMPGASVKVHRSAGGVTIGSGGEYTELPARRRRARAGRVRRLAREDGADDVGLRVGVVLHGRPLPLRQGSLRVLVPGQGVCVRP